MGDVEILLDAGGSVVGAWDEEILELGYGETEDEARRDLERSARESYHVLSQMTDRQLSQHLIKVRDVLVRRYAEEPAR